jgi:ABC-type Mn2+/Zn2+ transport system ATPase subunit
VSCAVELRGVTVSHRGNPALYDVTLDIPEGDFTAVIGPNGAGKTTLLTVINGLGRIHCGALRIFGQPVTPAGMARLRPRIGYVAQHERMDRRMPVTCYESVLLGCYGRVGLLRRPNAKDHSLAGEMMQLTGTAHLRDRPVGQVSGGEARKVALTRALTQQPRILLLDEPMTNLDPPSVRELLALVVDIRRRFSLTVVMVTHRLEDLPDACNRVVMLRSGRVLHAGPRASALTPELLARLYGNGD